MYDMHINMYIDDESEIITRGDITVCGNWFIWSNANYISSIYKENIVISVIILSYILRYQRIKIKESLCNRIKISS